MTQFNSARSALAPLDNTIAVQPSAGEFYYKTTSGQTRYKEHRFSGCSFFNHLFTMQVRSAKNTTDEVNFYYPDVQDNPYTATPDSNLESASSDCLEISAGNTFGTAGTANFITGITSRFLTAMCAETMGAAYATWLEVPYSTDLSPNDSGDHPPLNVNAILLDATDTFIGSVAVGEAPLTLVGAPGSFYPRDMACTVVGKLAYYFLTYWETEGLYYFVFDGQKVSKITEVENFSQNDTELWTMDATTVYRGTGSPDNPECIAITVGVGVDNGCNTVTQLFTLPLSDNPSFDSQGAPPALTAGDVICNAPLPASMSWVNEGPDYHEGPAVRTCWGTACNANNIAEVKNGLCVFYSVTFQDAHFIQMTIVDVTEISTSQNFQDLLSNAYHSKDIDDRNPSIDASCCISATQSGSYFPGSEDSVGYAVIYAVQMEDASSAEEFIGLQFSSYRFSDTGVPTRWGDPFGFDWSAQDFETAMASWTLLGVIAGAPPVPNGSDISSTISFSFSQTDTQKSIATTSNTQSATVKTGGDLVSGGYSKINSTSNSNSTATSVSLTADKSYSHDNPDLGRYGLYVFVRPIYTQQVYTIYTWDGQPLDDVEVTLLRIESMNWGVAPFQLTDPTMLVDRSDVIPGMQQVLSQFADGITPTAWPNTDDLNGWIDFSANNPGFSSGFSGSSSAQAEIANTYGFNVTPFISDVSDQQTFASDADRDLTSETKLNIDVSLDLKYIKIGGSYEHSGSTEFDFSQGSEFDVSVSYNNLLGQTFDEFFITPWICFPSDVPEDPPWIPEVFAGQRPWLITWFVGGKASNG